MASIDKTTTAAVFGRVRLTVEQALERIEITPDYDPGGVGGPRDCVHTLRSSGFMQIGAHWDVNDLRAAMQKHGVEEAGPEATGHGHGLVMIDDHGPVFIATKQERP
jgi:hypothetical protein